MAQFKELRPTDVSTSKLTNLQILSIPRSVISGSTNRRKYAAFMTGGVGPGVTSSLFQTIHDQDWRLSSANPVFDMTVGLFTGSNTVLSASTDIDSAGNFIFTDQSLMMQQKIDVYRQYAQVLLGDSRSQFVAPFSSTDTADLIDEALFISFRRQFSRDGMQGDTFAMVMQATGANVGGYSPINVSSPTVNSFITDIGTDATWVYGGEVGNVITSSNINNTVGLFFYDHGTLVLDAKKIFDGNQAVTGAISALSPSGFATIGGSFGANPNATFIPDFFVSASIDDIVDCFASTRFNPSTNLAVITAQNKTYVNSSVYTCRAAADEFNFSLNPTFTDPDGRIVVIEDPASNQRTFTFITAVGLYDANDNLLAVAKLSRPYYKDNTIDVTFRVRLNM